MNGADTSPLLSVLVITYNQERYLGQALDSALGQETDFGVEIVVGEDGSTDGTREVLEAYRNAHPTQITALFRESNLGMMPNFVSTFRACTGRYMALLEGDDYWTDTQKLQRQVDLLEGDPGLSSTFHNVEVVHEDREHPNHLFHKQPLKSRFSLRDVVSGFFVPTCSTVFRAGLWTFPDWFETMPMGDWPLHVLNAEHGDLGYLDRVMGAYRVHGSGVWTGARRVDVLRKGVESFEVIDNHLQGRYRIPIRRLTAEYENKLARELHRRREGREAIRHGMRAVLHDPFRAAYARDLLKTVLRYPWRSRRSE